MSSAAQIDANRENAQHSTGPTSAAGRAASSQNARTHGLRSPYLTYSSLEEQKQFDDWCAGLRACLLPGTEIEEELFRQMTIHGWKARQGEALYTACYNIGVIETINAQFEAQGTLTPENRLKLEIPGATPAETLAAVQQDPQVAANLYMLGMRRRPSILTLQRMITSHENAFNRHRKELTRLIAERQKQEQLRQTIESTSPRPPAQTNPIPPPNPHPISRNSSCPCGSGHRFKRCCMGKKAPAA